MRRVVITLGIVAILLSSCGGNEPPARFASTLQDRVASIRELAEAGRPRLALGRLRNVVASVTTQLERGRVDAGWALEIFESAQAVELQLRPLPATPSETNAPSPSPNQEEEGGGEGNGKSNGKDKGSDDEGHGKDD
jgi:hypothetical protein